MQQQNDFEVRAGEEVLYAGNDVEEARKVFFAVAKEQAYYDRKITFYVNGNIAAEFLERPDAR